MGCIQLDKTSNTWKQLSAGTFGRGVFGFKQTFSEENMHLSCLIIKKEKLPAFPLGICLRAGCVIQPKEKK